MKSTGWKDTAELVGIAAIVASLVFVGMEMRQAQRIAFAEQQGALIADTVDLNESIGAHAELIIKVNSGTDLSEEQRIKAVSLLRSYWNNAFFGYRRWYFLDHPALEAPVRVFARFLCHNPGMRKLWNEEQAELERDNDLLGYSSVEGGAAQVNKLLDDFLAKLNCD